MNETIRKALVDLENANISGYFEEMDRVERLQQNASKYVKSINLSIYNHGTNSRKSLA
ncbi:MAG: hypothetical protein NW226_00540 [Microscillaceae bacterium]|nr:hypothetical protein [Microscillaceae bacterium]